jgi:phytoene/squalene synthetase
VKETTKVNFKLLHRMVNFQMFDIERGSIQTMRELEVYGENTRSLMMYLNLHLLGIDDANANICASHVGRALGICDVIKKTPYYLAVHRGYLPTEVLNKHNLYYDRIWSRQGGEAIVADEFYDVVLELAAYAKKHIEAARKIHAETPLPSHAHRAFLLA